MKKIFTIILFIIFFFPVFAQVKQLQCIYIPDNEKYVLSENIISDFFNKIPVTFNSLFIWQGDKVIRILFHYQKTIEPERIQINRLLTISSIIPVVKDYKFYNMNHPERFYATGNLLDNIGETGSGKDEILGESIEDRYKQKVLIAINKWNRKYNPMADIMSKIIVSDSDPYRIVRNKKRKNGYINNLPLVFRMQRSDSFYLIKPYRIDIYKSATPLLTMPDRKDKLEKYTLYTTLSLIDNSFSDATKDMSLDAREQYNPYMNSFISYHTILSLYKFSLPAWQTAVVKYLSSFPLAAQKHQILSSASDSIAGIPCSDIPYNEFMEDEPSSFYNSYAQQSSGKIDFRNCPERFQYCNKCYDSGISITEKIRNHCPINIVPRRESWPDENWSYLFSYGKHSFF